MPPSKSDSESTSTMAEHDQVTLDLAKKESAEHMKGMDECLSLMNQKPLRLFAYALNDPNGPSNDADNVKVVHFVRHGQGFHNLMADLAKSSGIEWTQYKVTEDNPYTKPELVDSPLTEKGRIQAARLQPLIKDLPEQPQLVVSSPNCRALQTALIAFEHLVHDENAPFLSHEMAREENGVHVCDKRRPTSQQARDFPMFDFSLLETEEDVIFREDRRETKLEVGERVYKFFEWLHTRDEKHVAVASHSAWLMTVFNGVVECDVSLKPWFQTGEMRSVKLVFEPSST